MVAGINFTSFMTVTRNTAVELVHSYKTYVLFIESLDKIGGRERLFMYNCNIVLLYVSIR